MALLLGLKIALWIEKKVDLSLPDNPYRHTKGERTKVSA
jgi:hypothetical protein